MTAWLPPVEAAWRDVLAAALGRAITPSALATMVAKQSQAYLGEPVVLSPDDSRAARTLFWFPRDLPKPARAIAELHRAGALPARPTTVLDLGAGMGATSVGALRTLAALAAPPAQSWTAVDRDPTSLALLRRVAEGARRAGLLPAETPPPVTSVVDLAAPNWSRELGTHDLVLAGLTAVEFTRSLGNEAARGEAVATFAREALRCVADDGALVLLEPGSRTESRALHHARARLLADGAGVFAPCLHAGDCPMLRNDRDWCHEDLADVSLPPWLVDVARGAGLRWEGPTWSYLVLRRDRRTLREALPAGGVARMVSRPLVTKGKTEALWCGAPGSGRVLELDRAVKGRPGPHLRDLPRGELVTFDEAAGAGAEERAMRLEPSAWRAEWPTFRG